MAIWKGLGNYGFRTTDISGGPTAQVLFPTALAEFEFSQSSTFEDALSYRAGLQAIEETVEGKVESTLKVKSQIPNWSNLGFSFGLLQKTLTSFTLPTVVRTTVPVGGVITDTNLTATPAGTVSVAVENYSPTGYQTGPLSIITTGSPTARQVKVDGTATTLTFHSSAVGASIMYFYNRSVATANVFGGPGVQSRIGEIEFYGEVFDTSSETAKGGNIWLPKCVRHKRPTLSMSGKLLELEMEFRALIPSGWEEPYMLVDGHSIA